MGNHSKCNGCGELDEFCACKPVAPSEPNPSNSGELEAAPSVSEQDERAPCTHCGRSPGDRCDECEHCPANTVSEQNERARWKADYKARHGGPGFPLSTCLTTERAQESWATWQARAALNQSAQATQGDTNEATPNTCYKGWTVENLYREVERLSAQAAPVCAKCGKPRSDHSGAPPMLWCRTAVVGQTFEPCAQAAQGGGGQAEPGIYVSYSDDAAVDLFAAAMKSKMAASRAKGRGGWHDPDDCPAERLQTMLINHLAKGDPVDVANFAMMLWNRGEPVAANPAPSAALFRQDEK